MDISGDETVRFRDRQDAGVRLADRLIARRFGPFREPVVLGLARGGVPVAAEVAVGLGAVLDVFVARKIGAPGQEELGVGAVAEGTDEVVLSDTAAAIGLDAAAVRKQAARQRDERDRRVKRYRGGRPLPHLVGRDVILVDDGLATGVTAEAALRALRAKEPRRLILAVPVCAPDTRDRLAAFADLVVCLAAPSGFGSVGVWYDDFDQTTDDEVLGLLSRFTRAA